MDINIKSVVLLLDRTLDDIKMPHFGENGKPIALLQ